MKEIDLEIKDYQAVLSKELTPDLAALYVGSLLNLLTSESFGQELVKAGQEWHYQVGKELYGPLINGYCKWLESKCIELGHTGGVYFALRDAAPLMESAKVLWKQSEIHPVGIYANRPLLGIEDEISPEISHVDGNMQKYLKGKALTNKEIVVWSDTGAWGTVIKVLKQGVLSNHKMYPFFWYSHNPNIPGYLNELLNKIGADAAIGEVLNDSLECVFPQQHLRPVELVQINDGWDVKLENSGDLSAIWGQAALSGVKDSAINLITGKEPFQEIKALKKLIEAHENAKENNVVTGVLPSNTPTWSKGSDFLLTWSASLLP